MSISKETATNIAADVHTIRPGWHQSGVIAAIAEVRDYPVDVVAVAAYAAARDENNRTPAVIPKPGEHWRIAYQHRQASAVSTTRRRCHQCSGWHRPDEEHDERQSVASPDEVPEYVAARRALATVAPSTAEPDPTPAPDHHEAKSGTQEAET